MEVYVKLQNGTLQVTRTEEPVVSVITRDELLEKKKTYEYRVAREQAELDKINAQLKELVGK